MCHYLSLQIRLRKKHLEKSNCHINETSIAVANGLKSALYLWRIHSKLKRIQQWILRFSDLNLYQQLTFEFEKLFNSLRINLECDDIDPLLGDDPLRKGFSINQQFPAMSKRRKVKTDSKKNDMIHEAYTVHIKIGGQWRISQILSSSHIKKDILG